MQYQVIIDDSKQQAKAVLALLKTIEGVSIQPVRTSSTASASKKAAKEEFLENFKEGLAEVKQIREGKLKARPLNELLNGH